jgi:hypothetical protein
MVISAKDGAQSVQSYTVRFSANPGREMRDEKMRSTGSIPVMALVVVTSFSGRPLQVFWADALASAPTPASEVPAYDSTAKFTRLAPCILTGREGGVTLDLSFVRTTGVRHRR